jgi:hypothetical protein
MGALTIKTFCSRQIRHLKEEGWVAVWRKEKTVKY